MYRMIKRGWIKHWDFMLLDLLCLQISFVCANFIRHGYIINNTLFLEMTIMLITVDLIVMFLMEPFKDVLKRGYYKEFVSIVQHSMLVGVIITFIIFFMRRSDRYSRVVIAFTFVLFILISYFVRSIWKQRIKRTLACKSGDRRLLIICSNSRVQAAIENIVQNNYGRFHIVGILIVDNVSDEGQIDKYVSHEAIDEVYIDLPEKELSEDTIDKLVDMGVAVHKKVAELKNTIGRKRSTGRIGTSSILTISTNVISLRQLFVKRAMDIMGGIVGCLITLVLFVFIAPLILIKSPGPIFFTQVRVGRNGRRFKLYKFRSMYTDAEERKAELQKDNKFKNSLMFKIKYDPRIIGNEKGKGIGYFIRNHSLDEFPQFFNVLKGDMSLVGTRPPTIDEWDKYEFHHRGRMSIKPGMTGIWQISNRDEISDFDKIVEMDKEYIYSEWTPGRDILIILHTCLKVVKG